MDASETYRHMCIEAKEIQKLWEPREGDFAYYNDCGHFDNIHCISGAMLSEHSDEHELFTEVLGNTNRWLTTGKFDCLTGVYTWLPRQDQLQEMIKIQSETAWGLQIRFYNWVNWYIDAQHPIMAIDGSMEQLWLGFVMYQKYHKIWTGKDWKGAK